MHHHHHHHHAPFATSPFALLPASTAGSDVTTLAPALTYTPPASSPAELDLSHLASSPHDSITSPPPTSARTPPLSSGPARKRSATPPVSPLCKIDEEDPSSSSSAVRPRHAPSGSLGGVGGASASVVDPHHPALASSSIADSGYAGLFAGDDEVGGVGSVSFSDSIMDFLKTSEAACADLSAYAAEPADEDEESFRLWPSMDAGEF